MNRNSGINVLMILMFQLINFISGEEDRYTGICVHEECYKEHTYVHFQCSGKGVINVHTAIISTSSGWTPGKLCPVDSPQCTRNSTDTYELCQGRNVCNMSDDVIKIDPGNLCLPTNVIQINYTCQQDDITSDPDVTVKQTSALDISTTKAPSTNPDFTGASIPTRLSTISPSENTTTISNPDSSHDSSLVPTDGYVHSTDGNQDEGGNIVPVIAGSVIGAVVLIALVTIIIVIIKRKQKEQQQKSQMINSKQGNNKISQFTNPNGFSNTYIANDVRNEDTIIVENNNYGSYDGGLNGNKNRNDEDTEIVDNDTYHTIVGDNGGAKDVSPPYDDRENELVDNLMYHTVADDNKENKTVEVGDDPEMIVNENYSSFGDVDEGARDNIPRPTMTKSSDDIIDPLHSDETTQRKIGPNGDLYTTVVGPFNE